MIYTIVAGLAFFAPPTALPGSAARGTAMMTAEQPMLGRRAMLQGAAAAVVAAAPLAAVADGASSKAVLERSRAIYGSRVFRLQDASAEAILEEKNAFALFTTGAYPRTGNAAFKDTQSTLKDLGKKAIASAKAGDKAGANAAVKEFVKAGNIRELDIVKGGNFDPTQRRNPGAPPTSEIEAQMGTQAFALYKPLK